MSNFTLELILALLCYFSGFFTAILFIIKPYKRWQKKIFDICAKKSFLDGIMLENKQVLKNLRIMQKSLAKMELSDEEKSFWYNFVERIADFVDLNGENRKDFFEILRRKLLHSEEIENEVKY